MQVYCMKCMALESKKGGPYTKKKAKKKSGRLQKGEKKGREQQRVKKYKRKQQEKKKGKKPKKY